MDKTVFFRLFELPTELQLAIFENAVVSNEPICITRCWASLPDWRPGARQLAVTRTSKFIRHVTLKIFHQRNIFEIGTHDITQVFPYRTTNLVAPWLMAIGWQNRDNLRGVRLNHDLESCAWKSGYITRENWLKRHKILSSLGANIVRVQVDPKSWQLVQRCCWSGRSWSRGLDQDRLAKSKVKTI